MDQARIEQYFSGREGQLVEAVSRLVRIDSTLGDAQPGQPFGPGPAAALEEFLDLSRQWGLPGKNLEGYVGTVDLGGPDIALHILGHLDVVPAGEGWTVTDAFTPKLVDGLLYGRGTDDDKGPLVAALMAMKAVKDLEVPLKQGVRLILGTDEETGFRDIRWYYDRHPYAPYTISPDADFPIINIEKGHYQPTFSAAWPLEEALPRVASITGGPRRTRDPLHPHPSKRGPAHPLCRAERPRLHPGGGPQCPDRPAHPSVCPAPGPLPLHPGHPQLKPAVPPRGLHRPGPGHCPAG